MLVLAPNSSVPVLSEEVTVLNVPAELEPN